MTGYFLKTLWVHVRSGKTLYLLTLAGVALGVAAVLCIQILNQNALSAFVGSVRAVSGRADLMVVGRTPDLPEALYPRVLATPGVAAAWPLYRIDVSLAGRRDFFLEIVGVDFYAPVRLPLTAGRFTDEGPQDNASPADRFAESSAQDDNSPADRQESPAVGTRPLAIALTTPGWVAVTPALAAEMGWQVGDSLLVSSGSRTAQLRIGALVDFQRFAPLATRKLAVMDIAQAQGLLGTPGRLQEIDVKLAEGADPQAVSTRLARRLGPAVQVLSPEQRRSEAAGLLAAFRLNLTALSLISLFVGVFLIYSSVQAALVRRRGEFGLLRSLGATTPQVVGIILAEVLLLGILGTAIGIPLGWWAAERNVAVVSATLTNIYLLEEIERLRVPPLLYLLAAGIGVGGALLGALLPALDISRRDTRALLAPFTLHERTSRAAPRLALAAVLLAAAALGWFLLGGRTLRWSGFVLGFVLLVVLPLLTPLFIRLFCARLSVRSFGFGYSLRNLSARLQTTAFALASLAVAVSMLIGITLLIGSFRATLQTWIDETVRADVYVTTESWARAGGQAVLTPDVLQRLTSFPGVAAAERVRIARATVYPGGRRIGLTGLAVNLRARGGRIPLYRGESAEVVRRVAAGAVSVSEPLARKEHLAVGDSLALYGPRGIVRLPIAGISYDYSNESGWALIHPATLERIFGPGPVNNVTLYLEPGVGPEATVDRLKAAFTGVPLVIRSNRQLRAEILEIFDQTFAITRILQFMALLIAICGISLTLIILARERVAELALYRSLGARRRQIFGIFLGEGVSLGLLGSLLGCVGGAGLAAILIFLINRAYFGWTIRPAWPGPEVLRELLLILLAAAVASIYPAVRASRTPATELSLDR
jgi:putative ABC transport system permease protein